MASLVLIDLNGDMKRSISTVFPLKNLGFDLKLIHCRLSWREDFYDGYHRCPPQTQVIEYGKHTRIYLHVGWYQGHQNHLSVQIESQDEQELIAAIEKTIAYIGGRVTSFGKDDSSDSFLRGITNDCRWMWNLVKDRFAAVRQRLSFRIAG